MLYTLTVAGLYPSIHVIRRYAPGAVSELISLKTTYGNKLHQNNLHFNGCWFVQINACYT